MKGNIIIHNNTFKIKGTSNVAIATIASADQVHARKGDSCKNGTSVPLGTDTMGYEFL